MKPTNSAWGRITLLASLALLAAGCATSPPQSMSMRSLAEPVPLELTKPKESNGSFRGIEKLSRGSDGKINANVLLVHGIGWTQESKNVQVGFDFVQALEEAYGVPVNTTLNNTARLCTQSSQYQEAVPRFRIGGLDIRRAALPDKFFSDDPKSPLMSTAVACLDRIDIVLGTKGIVHLYRLLWDDAFYNAYEYPHLGYDDSIMAPHEKEKEGYGGYEDINALRLKRNAEYKTSLITYGLSDAAMYIGPAGRLLRDAVRGGICATINEATGRTHYFEQITASRDDKALPQAYVQDLCGQAGPARTEAPLVIVSESLGSRVVFDVLTRMRHEGAPDQTTDAAAWDSAFSSKLSQVKGSDLEIYLLANQIPLIGTGMISPNAPATTTPVGGKQIRFVAFSEINDLLTYELVPYFEHFAYLRCRNMRLAPDAYPGCISADPEALVRSLKNDRQKRSELIKELGFEVIDVRLQFAKPISTFVPDFADPLEAHTKHMQSSVVRNLILCGANSGKVNTQECGINGRQPKP